MISRGVFVQKLASSGLMDVDEVARFLANSPPDQLSVDCGQMVRELVADGKLTQYQADQICTEKGQPLVLGDYFILDKLGQGGMGRVLKAEHKQLKCLVALKVMSPRALKSSDAVKRFHREVEAGAKLTHPNIVTTHSADEVNGTHFLVMELVDGIDLSAFVKKHGPLPVEQAVNCVLQAARGLEHAHAQGVIHRDIKPANLLIDGNGTVKILDMGLALIDGGRSTGARLTSAGTIMGTVDFMSPEQATDSKFADERSDVYSLGCSLHYLLTGTLMYDGDTMLQKLKAHAHAPIPALSAVEWQARLNSDAVAQLANLNRLFQRMVAKRPEDRPQSMTALIADLEQCSPDGSSTLTIASFSSREEPGLTTSGFNELQSALPQKSIEGSTAVASARPATNPKSTAEFPVAGNADAETTLSARKAGTDPHIGQT